MYAAALFKFQDMARVKEQPTIDEQRELNSVVEDEISEVKVRNTTYRLRYMRNATIRRITDVMLNEKDDSKVSSKCAALMVLNGYFKIKFFYWFLWRWFYYVKQYLEIELHALIDEGKKKVRAEDYYINTIFLIGMKDTMIAMTREEAERFRQELSTAQRTT